jgi:hypothetical protein
MFFNYFKEFTTKFGVRLEERPWRVTGTKAHAYHSRHRGAALSSIYIDRVDEG